MTEQNSLEVLVQRQSDLRRHVNEALAQQQPHGLAGVTQDLLQLLHHAVRGALLAAIQEQLLHLLHALHVLSTSQLLRFPFSVVKNNFLLFLLTSITSYLPLREVEHCDEAKHLVWVIIITVFWHLSLLRGNRRDVWVGNVLITTAILSPVELTLITLPT